MVLDPIESMITKIRNISKDPLGAMQKAEQEEYLLCLEEEQAKTENCCHETKKKNTTLETIVLERTIIKIGALLALGFGEAGSEIIAQNMQNNEGGDVDPMIEGKRVLAIFGFCDIRNFTDSTEILQEDVMIFVNEIAAIVHGITTDHLGSANKNIGDAFLLVWKIDPAYVIEDETTGEIVVKDCNEVTQLIDLAVIAFLKIQFKVYKSFLLDKVRIPLTKFIVPI